MLKEFRTFIARGNVLDLAVAVIIGAAFATITTSLTEDLIMPVIGAIFGGLDFSSYFVLLGPVPEGYRGSLSDYAALKAAGAPVLGWGQFVTVLIKPPDPRLHHLPDGARGEPAGWPEAGCRRSDRSRAACRDQGRAEEALATSAARCSRRLCAARRRPSHSRR